MGSQAGGFPNRVHSPRKAGEHREKLGDTRRSVCRVWQRRLGGALLGGTWKWWGAREEMRELSRFGMGTGDSRSDTLEYHGFVER